MYLFKFLIFAQHTFFISPPQPNPGCFGFLGLEIYLTNSNNTACIKLTTTPNHFFPT